VSKINFGKINFKIIVAGVGVLMLRVWEACLEM
jgi:hypothetical protein